MLDSWEVCISTKEETELIWDKIVQFKKAQVPFPWEQTPISHNYVVKDNGQIIAGITSWTFRWGLLYVDVLFVEQHYRNQDIGSFLLAKVENEAMAMGAKFATVDTFDFQAKDFYLKHGYEIYGLLDDCPPGHQHFSMKKSLQG